MRIIGAVLAVPALALSGGIAGGGGCNYTKPKLVYDQACTNDTCREQVQKHLPTCQRQLAGQLSKTIRHKDGVAKAPYLSMAVMDDLTACIASASYNTFDPGSVELSAFREVSKDVRGDTPQRAGGACEQEPCSGIYTLPVVGQTTFLYGPA